MTALLAKPITWDYILLLGFSTLRATGAAGALRPPSGKVVVDHVCLHRQQRLLACMVPNNARNDRLLGYIVYFLYDGHKQEHYI